ncbi:hypothetical protein [Vibrio diabolicus]|uniref:hypothetical protein n=1 Tax=Vibrio diabolicus TaxID=50719 RepID=UPI003751C0A8
MYNYLKLMKVFYKFGSLDRGTLTRIFKLYIKSKRLKRIGVESINLKELIGRIESKRQNKTCHIIGSGASLNGSKKIIDAQDYVMGCNYSGISRIKHDLYFTEFAGESCKNVFEDHKQIIKTLKRQGTLTLFKNIWHERNEIEYISDLFSEQGVMYIEDYIIHNKWSRYELDSWYDYILNQEETFLPQMSSSVVTMLFLAIRCGFDKIYIHGVDFGGLYFYQSECYDNSGFQNMNVFQVKSNNMATYNNPDKVHATARSKVGISEVLSFFNSKASNVNIIAAKKGGKLDIILKEHNYE